MKRGEDKLSAYVKISRTMVKMLSDSCSGNIKECVKKMQKEGADTHQILYGLSVFCASVLVWHINGLTPSDSHERLLDDLEAYLDDNARELLRSLHKKKQADG